MKRAGGMLVATALLLASAGVPRTARAADGSATPFIDQLRQQMRDRGERDHPEAETDESYTDAIKRKLKEKQPDQAGDESYIDKLRRERGLTKPEEQGSFTEKEKERLGPSTESGAIDAVREGRSTLHARRSSPSFTNFGFSFGTAVSRNITGDPTAVYRNFGDVYGTGFAPDVAFTYEQEFLHNPNWGSLGFWAGVEVSYFKGSGTFAVPITNAANGISSQQTGVSFQFFPVPLMAGLSYRMNLLRILRPYARVGPMMVGYYEARSDNEGGKTGHSEGIFGTVGVLLPLDWISPHASWDAYSDSGIQHIDLAVAYLHESTFTGPVSFGIDGVTAGITFEF